MAEIEVAGVKASGSKLLLILPVLGTLIGGLWGGFELYSRLLDAEEKLMALDPEEITQQVELFRETSTLELKNLQDLTTVIKDELREDITEANRLARSVETSSASTQREIRNDVYEMERFRRQVSAYEPFSCHSESLCMVRANLSSSNFLRFRRSCL